MRPSRLLLPILLASAALSPAAYAAFPGHNGEFAYEVLTGGIRTIEADGDHDAAAIRTGNQMSYSADGRSLVYAGKSGSAGVWTARADGSGRHQVLDPTRTRLGGRLNYLTVTPRFSPGGERIVFTAVTEVRVPGDDDEVESRTAIATIGTDGRGLRLVRAGESPSWSPDGKRIAYLRDNAIETIRPDGSARRTLLAGSGEFRKGLDYAPDGRRLAFLEYREAGTVIRVLDIRTGTVTTIDTSAQERVDAVAWAPNGKRLAYVSVQRTADRTPPSSVITIRPDGTERKVRFQLALDPKRGRWAENLAWQPRP